MELSRIIQQRRMVRAFSTRPIPDDVLERLWRCALSGPSAGNSQGLEMVVLVGPEQTGRFWEVSLPAERRQSFPWPGLLDAPALAVLVQRPSAYVERYAEPDKAGSGLGERAEAWAVPYWHVDGGMAAGFLLLAAVDEGLGALFFGMFDHEREVLAALGVPEDRCGIGVVALGYPDEVRDHPSRSAARPRRPLTDTVHRGRW